MTRTDLNAASSPEPTTEAQHPAPRAASRRDVLRTAGLVVFSGGAVLTLAACGADGQAGTPVSTSAAPSEPATSAAPSASTSTSASPSSKASSAAPAPSGPSVATADVPVGGGVILKDANFVVTQPVKGTYKAFSKICTHQGCPVASIADGGIKCPCHGSVFSVKDGSVLKPPANKPLAESAVTVSGAKVYVTG